METVEMRKMRGPFRRSLHNSSNKKKHHPAVRGPSMEGLLRAGSHVTLMSSEYCVLVGEQVCVSTLAAQKCDGVSP